MATGHNSKVGQIKRVKMSKLLVSSVSKLLSKVSSETRFKIARFIKWVTFAVLRYPCYDHKKLVEMSHTLIEPDEQVHYFAVSAKRFRVRQMLFLIMCLANYFVYTAVGFSRIFTIDYLRPEKNVFKLENGLTGYSCLATNCNRISRNASLEVDLVQFPFFRLCYNYVAPLFPPLVDGGRAPAYFLSILVNGDIVYIGTPNILQWIAPQSDSPMMYIFAPKTEIKMFRNKVKIYLRDISSSWLNTRQIMLNRYAEDWQRATGCPFGEAQRYIDSSKYNSDQNREFERMLYASYPHPDETKYSQLESYVDDCLPNTRTSLWRRQAEVVAVVSTTLTIQAAIAAPIVTIVGMIMFMDRKQSYFDTFVAEIEHQNCSFWRLSNASNMAAIWQASQLGQSGPVLLDQVDSSEITTDWSLFALVNTFFVSFMSVIALTQLYTWCYLNSVELCYWFDELLEQITALTEMAKIQRIYKTRMSTRDVAEMERESKRRSFSQFLLKSTRDQFLVKYGNPFALFFRVEIVNLHPSCGPKLSHVLDSQKDTVDTLSGLVELELDLSFVEMLEKVYINLRVFLDYFEGYSTSLIYLAFYSSAVPYICGFLFVIGLRKTEQLPEPYVMLAAIFVELIIKIAAGATFHATVSSSSLEQLGQSIN